MGKEVVEVSRRKVFREEIRNAIREAIFSGELNPGDRIIETYWAKTLNVSQGPVREAIRDLEAAGLVETIPFKGSHVRIMTKKDIQDNYSVRMCLESKSVRDVISLLDDHDLASLMECLKSILKQMDDYASSGDLRNFTDCDTAFHRAVIEAAGNPVLLHLWEQCNLRIWFLVSELKDISTLRQLLASHQQLFHAIGERDVTRATFILERDITATINSFVQK